jgi:hypothetical protein
MTDPSYAGQIVTFTFPHIGNVGVNHEEDNEAAVDGAVGCIVREDVTDPSNFRSEGRFDAWMKAKGKIIAGLDTRALTRRIRLSGAPNAVIAYNEAGEFDLPALLARRSSGRALKAWIWPDRVAQGTGKLGRFCLASGQGLWPQPRSAPACRGDGLWRQGQHFRNLVPLAPR